MRSPSLSRRIGPLFHCRLSVGRSSEAAIVWGLKSLTWNTRERKKRRRRRLEVVDYWIGREQVINKIVGGGGG
jgi:hypothetical protein